MNITDALITGLIFFGRNLGGLVVRPYETVRSIAGRDSVREMPYIALLVGGYFAAASLVRTHAFRPYLLTKEFVKLGAGFVTGFVLVTIVFKLIADFFGGKGNYKTVATSWAYTLIPTLCWFLTTSVLYIILPPPRTTSFQGLLFSALFLVFSSVLFFWKFMLAYLVLRFAMKMDLIKIGGTILVSLPVIGLYSWLMYKWGIFRIPFI